MNTVNMLGWCSVLLVSGSSAWQIAKTLRTGSGRDVAWGFLGMLAPGYTIGLVYGVLLSAFPVVAANVLSLVGTVGMALSKGVVGKRPEPDDVRISVTLVNALERASMERGDGRTERVMMAVERLLAESKRDSGGGEVAPVVTWGRVARPRRLRRDGEGGSRRKSGARRK